jgi:hypothetical protein
MSNTTYKIGDQVRTWATFKAASWTVTDGVPSASYALTDPTAVTLTVTAPDGTPNSYTLAGSTVTKDSLGVFYKDVTFAQAGTYTFKWAGTGDVVQVEAEQYYVYA